jgi:hypothetical protein
MTRTPEELEKARAVLADIDRRFFKPDERLDECEQVQQLLDEAFAHLNGLKNELDWMAYQAGIA